MKQNKYDDPNFFESYGRMPRSIEGLKAAGEWRAMRKMLPDFQHKQVLDLGCGYGWHCIYAKEQGATRVVRVHLSQKMIRRAMELSKDSSIEYKQMAIEDITRLSLGTTASGSARSTGSGYSTFSNA